MTRLILHSDMNACYASIEAKLNPSLKNKPLAVAGRVEDRHGIILAKSQEAKLMGVKTGEPIWKAKSKCPNLILVPPQYDKYLEHSRMARKIYYQYSNQVEPFGLDECRIDVTGSKKLFGTGEEMAYEIKERIKKELGITVSVGLSFNKVFAKLASDMKKPDAVTVIKKEDFKSIVRPLPVEAMIGVGGATKRKLNAIGIYSLGQLAKAPLELIKNLLYKPGEDLWNYANGMDFRPVNDFYHMEPIKSIGNSTTLRADLVNEREVFHVFQSLSSTVSSRLKENKLQAYGVGIYVRDSSLDSHVFQAPLSMPGQSSIRLARLAMEIFKENYRRELPVRALGIRAINLENEGRSFQLDVFSDYKDYIKKENLDQTLYKIRKKHGKLSVSFASLSRDIKFDQKRTDIVTLPNQLIR
jgi:DNA polymerase-4